MHTKDLTHSINKVSGKMTNKNPLIPDVPFHPNPVQRPPPKVQNSTNIEDINPNIRFDFKENSPFQEGVMSKTFQRPDK